MLRAYQFKSRIDNLFTVASQLKEDEAKAALSRHLCVLTSGFLELSVREILLDCVSTKAAPIAYNYVAKSLQNLTNLKIARITETLNKFNSDWGKLFEDKLSDEQRDAVDAVVANRNLIAHGQDVGMTLARARKYYDKTQEVIRILKDIVQS